MENEGENVVEEQREVMEGTRQAEHRERASAFVPSSQHHET